MAVSGSVIAQAPTAAFPNRPLTMIVPFAPGGSAEVLGREFGIEMTKLLGQNVVIELRPGAGGNIGAEYVAKQSRPDGYTTLLGSLSVSTNVSLMRLTWDPRKDLVPVAGIATVPNLLVIAAPLSS
jgi:tripartite-type tricarboxylate transporter receptor subunit TctC